MKFIFSLFISVIVSGCLESQAAVSPGGVGVASTVYGVGAPDDFLTQIEFFASSCIPTVTSTTFVQFDADTDCASAFVTNTSLSYPINYPGTRLVVNVSDTDRPQATISTLKAGKYMVSVTVPVQHGTAGSDVGIAISDGTDTRGQTNADQQATSDIMLHKTFAVFEYATDQTNKKFEIFGRASAGSIQLRADDGTGEPLKMVMVIQRYSL